MTLKAQSTRRHIIKENSDSSCAFRMFFFLFCVSYAIYLYDGFFQNTSHSMEKTDHTHSFRVESSRVSSVFRSCRSCSSVSSALAADKSQKTLCNQSRENKSHAHFHWKWIFISSSSPHPPHFHSSCSSCSCSSWFFGARVFNCRALRVGSSIKNAN